MVMVTVVPLSLADEIETGVNHVGLLVPSVQAPTLELALGLNSS